MPNLSVRKIVAYGTALVLLVLVLVLTFFFPRLPEDMPEQFGVSFLSQTRSESGSVRLQHVFLSSKESFYREQYGEGRVATSLGVSVNDMRELYDIIRSAGVLRGLALHQPRAKEEYTLILHTPGSHSLNIDRGNLVFPWQRRAFDTIAHLVRSTVDMYAEEISVVRIEYTKAFRDRFLDQVIVRIHGALVTADTARLIPGRYEISYDAIDAAGVRASHTGLVEITGSGTLRFDTQKGEPTMSFNSETR